MVRGLLFYSVLVLVCVLREYGFTDELDALDASNIIEAPRRTRGAKVDYVKVPNSSPSLESYL